MNHIASSSSLVTMTAKFEGDFIICKAESKVGFWNSQHHYARYLRKVER